MMDPAAHTQLMKVLKHLRCLKLWLKIFHVGLEPQPLHNGNGITCSPGVTTLFFASNPQIWANHNCGNGRMNPAAHTQHINFLKHIKCVKSKLETFHAGVDPQPLHNLLLVAQVRLQGFCQTPKSGQTTSVAMALCLLLLPTHSI